MKLRNREYGHTTAGSQSSTISVIDAQATPRQLTAPLEMFHLFPKLPTEIRHITWRHTLVPRIVELLMAENVRSFRSHARPPVALRVCADSRAAVLALYPARFGSAFKPPRIRFNFQLDTLYFDHLFDNFTFHFLDMLRSKDIKQITSIAIGASSGFDCQESDSHQLFWSNIYKGLKKFTALKEFIVVSDVRFKVEDGELLDALWNDITYEMELYDDVPEELVKRQEPGFSEKMEKHHCPASHWTNPKARLMWGWRRAEYREIV